MLEKNDAEDDYVFGCSGSSDALRKKLKRFFVGTQWKNVQSHDFRVSYATNAYQAGVPLLDISRAVGPSSISTTQLYVKDLD